MGFTFDIMSMMQRLAGKVSPDVKVASKLFTIYVEDIDGGIVVKVLFNEDKIDEVKRELETITGGKKTLNVEYVMSKRDEIISRVIGTLRNSIFMSAKMMGMHVKYKPKKK